MKSITVLISGSGSNLLALINACREKKIAGEIIQVIADRDCQGKNHALNANIPFAMLDRKLPWEVFAQQLLQTVPKESDLIVCAGFLSRVPNELIAAFPEKIINLHPSLLPEFGGMGMYGLRVHQAVIAAGKNLSGCSIHRVTQEIDGGEILAQSSVPVYPADTPEDLQKRISPVEHQLLVETVGKLLG